MYSFYLENKSDKGFAYIDHFEEKAIYNLCQNKKISFISQLWNRYYEDYTFDLNELETAKKDMMLYLSVEEWNLKNDEDIEQLNLIYKLIAIVLYAIFNKSRLIGKGD